MLTQPCPQQAPASCLSWSHTPSPTPSGVPPPGLHSEVSLHVKTHASHREAFIVLTSALSHGQLQSWLTGCRVLSQLGPSRVMPWVPARPPPVPLLTACCFPPASKHPCYKATFITALNVHPPLPLSPLPSSRSASSKRADLSAPTPRVYHLGDSLYAMFSPSEHSPLHHRLVLSAPPHLSGFTLNVTTSGKLLLMALISKRGI